MPKIKTARRTGLELMAEDGAKLDHLALSEVIDRFRSVRAETVDIVAAMTDADLDREGRHPFHGHGRLDRFVRWAYEHQRFHINDVRQALNG